MPDLSGSLGPAIGRERLRGIAYLFAGARATFVQADEINPVFLGVARDALHASDTAFSYPGIERPTIGRQVGEIDQSQAAVG